MSDGIRVNLWHAPYNGGWIGFDRRQWKSFRCGYGLREYNHIGEEEIEPVLHWCFFGFWGYIILQSWPWQSSPKI